MAQLDTIDARLIAAAPELLAALVEIGNGLTNADYEADGGLNASSRKLIRSIARAAIAKATGGDR